MSALWNETTSLLGGGNNNSQTVAQGTVTPIQNPVTAGQVNNATGTAQGATALQQALAAQLSGSTGQGTATQNQLAQALALQAQGGGPNPAQAALNQSTGTNVANQAALAAGVRGASSNPGLIARQAAQTGATTQQAAVGQAATLQAQQTLAAQQQAAALAAQQIGQGTTAANNATTGAEGEQSNLIGGINSQNAANEALQANQNTTNLGLASTNANNSAGAIGGLLNGAGGVLGKIGSLVSGAGGGAGGGSAAGSAGAGSSAEAGGASGTSGTTGDFAGSGGEPTAAKGGMVGKKSVTPPKGSNPKLPPHLQAVHGIYHMAVGGPVPELSSSNPGFEAPANTSPLGKSSGGGGKAQAPAQAPAPALAADTEGDQTGSSGGGATEVSGMGPTAVKMSAKGGGKVPGTAKVKGDSLKNDVVPIMASAGEIVLPRSVTQSDDPVGKSAAFVAALLAKEGLGHSDFQKALKTAISSRKKKAS